MRSGETSDFDYYDVKDFVHGGSTFGYIYLQVALSTI